MHLKMNAYLFGFVLMLSISLFVPSLANKMQPNYHAEPRDQLLESIPLEQSPWISGPGNHKYQFHIGKQSWLAAREKCLAQNADLVTIETAEEMQWLLTHYKPQFRHLRERQVQIGLLLEAPDGDGAQAREWRWVNGKPLDLATTKWTHGEPFDHAKGKERCALLNVNEQRIDDIDCDLGANADFNYRFVCQRSHEKHIEHESLNNPLWKKLEDILNFFGISSPENSKEAKNATLPNGIEEEGYWDRVFKNNTGTSLANNKQESGNNAINVASEANEAKKNENIAEGKNVIGKNDTENERSGQPNQEPIAVEGAAKSTVGTGTNIIGRDEEAPRHLEDAKTVVLLRQSDVGLIAASLDNNSTSADNKKKSGTKSEVKENAADKEVKEATEKEAKQKEQKEAKESNVETDVNKKEELGVNKGKAEVKIELQEVAKKEGNYSIVEEKTDAKKQYNEASNKTQKSQPTLIQDKHIDGRHGSNEGLEIVTEKKAKEQTASADDPTVILLASAEEKTAGLGVQVQQKEAAEKDKRSDAIGKDCSRANSAACIRDPEVLREANANATLLLSSKGVQQSPPEPILLHAIPVVTVEEEKKKQSNDIVEEKERKNDAKEDNLKKVNEAGGQAIKKVQDSASASFSSVSKPAKPDPLSVVAETLERSLSSKEEATAEDRIGKKNDKQENNINSDVKSGKGERIKWEEEEKKPKEGGLVQNRIKHLERIITAVQQMMGFGGEAAAGRERNSLKELENNEEKHDKKEEANEEKKKKIGNLADEKKQEDVHQNGNAAGEDVGIENKKHEGNAIAEVEEKSRSSDSAASASLESSETNKKESKKEQSGEEQIHESMMAMEGDFEEAENERRAHPGINSGDLVKNILTSSSEEMDKQCEEEAQQSDTDDELKKMKKVCVEKKKKNEEKSIQEIHGIEQESEPKVDRDDPENPQKTQKSRIEKYGAKIAQKQAEIKRKTDEDERGSDVGQQNKESTKSDDRVSILKGLLKMEKLVTKQIPSKNQEKTEKDLLQKGHQQQRRKETAPVNQQILDQLVHHRENKAIRDGDEIPSIEGIQSKKESVDKKEKQEDSNAKKLDSEAADDWVLDLNGGAKSVEKEGYRGTVESDISSTPLSVFPRPDFALIHRASGIPTAVEQNMMEEKKRVDAVYKLFNTRENVYDLLRRIQEAEAAADRPLYVGQSLTTNNEIGHSIDEEGSKEGKHQGSNVKQYISRGIIVERPRNNGNMRH